MITGVVASRYAVILTSPASDLMHNVCSMFLKYVVKFSALGFSPEADISFKKTPKFQGNKSVNEPIHSLKKFQFLLIN